VIIADKTKTRTKANFRYFTIISGVTNPILVKKYIMMGSSKIKPEAITDALINPT